MPLHHRRAVSIYLLRSAKAAGRPHLSVAPPSHCVVLIVVPISCRGSLRPDLAGKASNLPKRYLTPAIGLPLWWQGGLRHSMAVIALSSDQGPARSTMPLLHSRCIMRCPSGENKGGKEKRSPPAAIAAV